MHGLYGTLISSPAVAHLRVPAHLSGRIFEAAATVRPTRLQQATLAKIAEITARGALDQIDGEFQQAHFPGVIHALDNGAESFIFALDAAPGAIDYGLD